MFDELPRLFDRDFAVGHFLPVAAFVAISLGLIHEFGLYPDLLVLLQSDILLGTTVIGLVSWLGGICLLTTNRDILRFMQGYGQLNTARLLVSLERRRFQKLLKDIAELNQAYESCLSNGQEFSPILQVRRDLWQYGQSG